MRVYRGLERITFGDPEGGRFNDESRALRFPVFFFYSSGKIHAVQIGMAASPWAGNRWDLYLVVNRVGR